MQQNCCSDKLYQMGLKKSINQFKKYKLLSLLFVGMIACQSHKQIRWVMDREDILTEEQEKSLDSLYHIHEENTSNEIALITSSTAAPYSTLEEFAVEEANRLGVEKPENRILPEE